MKLKGTSSQDDMERHRGRLDRLLERVFVHYGAYTEGPAAYYRDMGLSAAAVPPGLILVVAISQRQFNLGFWLCVVLVCAAPALASKKLVIVGGIVGFAGIRLTFGALVWKRGTP